MLPKTQVSFKHQDDGDVMSARIDFQSPSHFSCEWQKTSASSSGTVSLMARLLQMIAAQPLSRVVAARTFNNQHKLWTLDYALSLHQCRISHIGFEFWMYLNRLTNAPLGCFGWSYILLNPPSPWETGTLTTFSFMQTALSC